MKIFHVYKKCKSCIYPNTDCELKFIKTVIVDDGDSYDSLRQQIPDIDDCILREVKYIEEQE